MVTDMSDSYFPPLLLLPDPFVLGLGSSKLAKDEHPPVFKLRVGNKSTWTRDPRRCDWHFTLYSIPGEEQMPRLTMASLEDLPEFKQPTVNWVALDWDTPDHEPWEDEDQMFEAFEALQELDVFETAGFYYTRAGFRLVWPLEESLPVSLATSFLSQLVDHVIQESPSGLADGWDEGCTDWTRLFRMPRTLRDGVFQDFPLDFDAMEYLNWEPPEPLEADHRRARRELDYEANHPDLVDLPRVEPEEWEPLAEYDWCERAKASEPLADEGERNETMVSAIGVILGKYGSTDPTLPFRLLAPSIEALDDYELTLDYLWDRCVHFAELNAGQQTLRDRVGADRWGDRPSNESRYLDLMEEAADVIGVPVVDVTEHLVIDVSPSFYVFNEHWLDYDPPTYRGGVLRGLRRSCPSLCPTTTGPRGGNLPHDELMARYSTPAHEVQLVIGQEGNFFDPETGTMYEGCASIRADLEPLYTPEIHQWLGLLGASLKERLYDWLATVMETSVPTCVMYLHGHTGAGKNLLATGVATLWNQVIPTKYENATAAFNEELLKCPVIWADEHVPNFNESGGASVFRQITGSGAMVINRKYRSSATLKGSPRLLITANNANALKIDEQLTSEDLAAIVQRVGYIRSGPEPAQFLESLGGWDTTRAWVDEFLIARHLLWLRENRHVTRRGRYLVSGWPSDLTRDLTTHAGLNGLSLIALIHYILEGAKDPMMPVGNGQVLPHTRTLMRRWQHFTGQKQPPNEQELAMALKTLSTGKERRHIKGKYVRLWRLDVDRVYLTAQKYNIAGRDELAEVINRTQAELEPVPDEKEAKRQNIFERENF